MDPERAEYLIACIRASDYACVTQAWTGPQLPYLPWYVADFNGNGMVAAMTDRQELWFRRLLERSWQMTCPCFLPNDPVFLANICRCNPLDFQGEGAVVIDRFKRTPDGKFLFHPRMLREYLQMRIRYEAQAAAGRSSAEKRRNRKLASTLAYTQAPTHASNNQNQNHIDIERDIPDDIDDKVREVFRAHPSNTHLKDQIEIPRNQAEAIFEAIAKDGFDLVLAGTKNLADAVAKWPKSDLRFIPNPVKFFREFEYRKDPEQWDRTKPERMNGKQPVVSAQAERIARNRSRILDAFTEGRGGDARPGIDAQEVRVVAHGDPVLEAPARTVPSSGD